MVDKPVCCMAETCLALRDGGSQQEPKAGKREGAETKELAHASTGETDQAAWKGSRSFKAARVWMKGLCHSAAGLEQEQFSRDMSPDVPVPNEPTVPTVWVYALPELDRPVRSGWIWVSYSAAVLGPAEPRPA